MPERYKQTSSNKLFSALAPFLPSAHTIEDILITLLHQSFQHSPILNSDTCNRLFGPCAARSTNHCPPGSTDPSLQNIGTTRWCMHQERPSCSQARFRFVLHPRSRIRPLSWLPVLLPTAPTSCDQSTGIPTGRPSPSPEPSSSAPTSPTQGACRRPRMLGNRCPRTVRFVSVFRWGGPRTESLGGVPSPSGRRRRHRDRLSRRRGQRPPLY
mmetsp:Transcript_8108/g.17557  ORF Transcript_8108/g.17557 Transcript_8108/m.17557 type:complete len:212 (-) Transcript_8108:1370-2005(-)